MRLSGVCNLYYPVCFTFKMESIIIRPRKWILIQITKPLIILPHSTLTSFDLSSATLYVLTTFFYLYTYAQYNMICGREEQEWQGFLSWSEEKM